MRIDGAAQQQRVACVEAGLLQPGRERRRQVEFGADLGALRAFAHHGGLGARAECQLQRVDQDGFARARLAGEDGEAVAQVELQLADDDEVAQRDAFQAH